MELQTHVLGTKICLQSMNLTGYRLWDLRQDVLMIDPCGSKALV